VLRRTSLALLAAALAGAAHAADPIDSKVWGSGASLQAPTWIDAKQILFLSGAGFKINESLRALAIWELDGKARVYRENVNYYCYREGMIAYKALDPADRGMVRGTWYAGSIGNERVVRKDAGGDVARLYDPLNCKLAGSQELQGKRPNRGIVPLLEKDGYLDLRAPQAVPGGVQQNTPVQFVRADNNAATKLPFGSREFNPSVSYFEFAGAYLIRSVFFDAAKRAVVFPWPADQERPLWTLKPDGSIAKQAYPKGPWTGKDDPAVYLTRAGLVLVRHGGIFDKTDGVYISDDKGVRHLLPGRAGPVGVSPDGCSIAFTHAPSAEADVEDPKENRRTLKVLRLCEPKS
jgi:hypothetical protein